MYKIQKTLVYKTPTSKIVDMHHNRSSKTDNYSDKFCNDR